MSAHLIVLALLAAVTAAYLVSVLRKRSAALSIYWSRSCTGRAWFDAFPHASASAVREFLQLVVDSFGFPRSRALKLEPSDSVLDLYRACNPDPTGPDSMELETLHLSLSEHYGERKFVHLPESVTLGELFARASASPPNKSLERTREG
jgi:hypothetical protein